MDIFFLYTVLTDPLNSMSALDFISQYQYIFAILAPVISGEVGMHLVGVLIGSNIISINAAIVSVIVILSYDYILYFLIYEAKKKYDVFGYIDKIKYISYINKKFQGYQSQYEKGYPFLLFAIKILPLTKFTIPFFSLYSNLTPRRFFVIDIAVTIVWALVLIVPGYLVGAGLLFGDAGQKLSNLILYGIAFLIFIIIFGGFIDKFLLSVNKKAMNLLMRKYRGKRTKISEKNKISQ